jgi:low temperature requirement protein LtrA
MSVHAAMPQDRRVTWTELFFDLVFVAAVSQVGAPLGREFGFAELFRFTLLLLVIWWAWHGYALYATRFDVDDAIERATTLLQMIAVMFMAANAEQGLDSLSSAGFAAAYGVMRLILAARYLRAAARPASRRLALEHAAGFGVAALVWIGSALVTPPARYVLWATALAVDLGTAIVAARFTVTAPPHASHLPERFGLFTLILLGEAIVAIMMGIQGQPEWSVVTALTALSSVVLVCGVWWAYFEGTGAAGHRQVRCRHDARRLSAWSAAHFPLYLGVALSGMAAEHAVRAGGWPALHGEEVALLVCGLALLAGALWAVHAARPRPGCCGA